MYWMPSTQGYLGELCISVAICEDLPCTRTSIMEVASATWAILHHIRLKLGCGTTLHHHLYIHPVVKQEKYKSSSTPFYI